MTDTQFRSLPDRLAAFRELLNNPVLSEAIVCLRDMRPSRDAHDSADAVTSVRILSRQSGYDAAIDLFLSLAEPLLAEQQEDDLPTFGVDLSQFPIPKS